MRTTETRTHGSCTQALRLVLNNSNARWKGPGLLESTYHTCLCRELELRQNTYRSQLALPIEYKGVQIARGYVIDLLVEAPPLSCCSVPFRVFRASVVRS